MKVTLAQLRKIIREEVDRNMRWSAGFGGQAGIGAGGDQPTNDLTPKLGDPKDDDVNDEKEEYGKEQQKTQFAARFNRERRTNR